MRVLAKYYVVHRMLHGERQQRSPDSTKHVKRVGERVGRTPYGTNILFLMFVLTHRSNPM